MGVMEHLISLAPVEGFTNTFLRRMEWSLIDQRIALSYKEECPTPVHIFEMNVIVWNCQGALGTNFRRFVMDLIKIHQPTIMIITETRVGVRKLKKSLTFCILKGLSMLTRMAMLEGFGSFGTQRWWTFPNWPR